MEKKNVLNSQVYNSSNAYRMIPNAKQLEGIKMLNSYYHLNWGFYAQAFIFQFKMVLSATFLPPVFMFAILMLFPSLSSNSYLLP